ncbi:MAG: 16S rRNA (uracil(1498)-N(3))-methyltransferase [Parcubacteria group bacterium]|nr:16S rRNA (uracil(1498)-N(3))-methyltransferase [Parcubacteria group bacterium]
MRLNRFIGDFDLDAGRMTLRDLDIVHQITRVLRLEVGEYIVLCDGAGHEAEGEISSIGKNEVQVNLGEKYKNENDPLQRIVLYLAVLKRENFEYAAEKATETGAAKIVPVISARTIKTGLNTERVRKIMKEAAEQSGRGIVPQLSEPMAFTDALQNAAGNDDNLFFHTVGGGALEFKRERGAITKSRIGVFIGPEGGWSDDEAGLAKDAGFIIASLGPLTLRAETAATIATYLAAH